VRILSFLSKKFVTPQNGGFTRTFWLFPDFCGKEFPEEFRAVAGSSNWFFSNFNNFNDTLGELVKNGISKLINSGGNSFPVGGRSLLNFRQNFQISDNPPPHLHSKRLFLALL
jgi:hypothetical protein